MAFDNIDPSPDKVIGTPAPSQVVTAIKSTGKSRLQVGQAQPIPFDDLSRSLTGGNRVRLLSAFAENSPIFGAFRLLLSFLVPTAKWRIEDAPIPGEGAAPLPGAEAGAEPGAEPSEDPEAPPAEPGAEEDPALAAPAVKELSPAAKFLDEALSDMRRPLGEVITEAVVSMVTYGWSFQEEIYKLRQGPEGEIYSAYDDGTLGVDRLVLLPANTLEAWNFENGLLSAMVQRSDAGLVEIPIDKAVHVTSEPGFNPEGRSLMRSAYSSWLKVNAIEAIQEVGIERDLAGYPVMRAVSPNPAQPVPDYWNTEDPKAVATLKTMIETVTSLRRNTGEGAVLPETMELELLSSGGSRQIDMGKVLDRYDYLIAGAWLMDALLLGRSSSGSFAMARSKMKMALSVLDGLLQRYADSLQRSTFARLLFLNAIELPEGRMPILAHDPLDRLADELVSPGMEETSTRMNGPTAPLRPRVMGED